MKCYNMRTIPAIITGSIALISAILYPYLLSMFSTAISLLAIPRSSVMTFIYIAEALFFTFLIFGIPLLAFVTLRLLESKLWPGKVVWQRRLFHLVFIISPLYVLFVLLVNKLGLSDQTHFGWMIFIIAIAFAIVLNSLLRSKKSMNNYQPVSKTWRTIHGIAALLFFVIFLGLHIFNHILALWSVQWHTHVSKILGSWYKSSIVEVLILNLLLVLIISGLRMAWYYINTSGDRFRMLQTCSGLYLSIFIGAHTLAVFTARKTGVNTDWYFATGKNGLLRGAAMLYPYYTLAIFLVLLHASLGLRKIMVDKKKSYSLVSITFYCLLIIALIVSIAISVATLGLKISRT